MKKKIPIIILILIVIAIDIYCLTARGEEIKEGWIVCQPDSCVNIRSKPKKSSEAFGELELCDKIYTDGKVVNGYLHCVDLPAETTEGWVSKVYVVYDEPHKPKYQLRNIIVEQGKVAARRTIGGKVRRWLHSGDMIYVYAITKEWCVTSEGFVMTEFIDNGGCYDENFYDDSPAMTWEDD